MATDYPSGFDTFIEPTLPEETSLSSAGSGDRNHVEHHRDMGDAIEALETNAALKGHDHSGVDDRVHGPKLLQANTHESVDTDTDITAIHHTLGTLANQAAAGDHVHDYNGSTIINKPYLICTAATRPTSPYFGLQIYETDTNRVRVWGQFGSRTLVPGVTGTDDFERVNTSNLGDTLWDQTYYDSDGTLWDDTHGKLAIPDGHAAHWTINGSAFSRGIARRIKTEDKETLSDDQVCTFTIGSVTTESPLPSKTISAGDDIYLRMSADKQSYWRVQVGYFYWPVYYTTTGPAGEELLGNALVGFLTANTSAVVQLIGRTLTIYGPAGYNSQIVDTGVVTTKGASNRGWGFGMCSTLKATSPFSPMQPANIASITVQDAKIYQSIARWTLLPVASVPNVRLYQKVAQSIAVGSSGSVVEWQDEDEDNFDCFDKDASLTDIVIKEPGEYSVDCSLSLNAVSTNDTVTIIVLINGVETPRQQRQILVGGGLSQTVAFSTKLRLDENDRLAIKVKHNKAVPLNLKVDRAGGQNIDSRLDVSFINP